MSLISTLNLSLKLTLALKLINKVNLEDIVPLDLQLRRKGYKLDKDGYLLGK